MVVKIASNIYKVNVDSNVYFLDFDEKIIIDTGPRKHRKELKQELETLVPLEKIQKVIFTHLHYDHTGNFDLFPKAKFYASAAEIDYFEKHKAKALLDPLLSLKFNIKLQPLHDMNGLKVIETPGHTFGSVSLLYEKEKILFSGDTLFANGIGRTDLPNSAPGKIEQSLGRLNKTKYKILCPGHDY